MEPAIEDLVRKHLIETPIHELQELAESLCEGHGLSEHGFVKLSEQIQNVHNHKTMILKLMNMTFGHLDKMTSVAKSQEKIIKNLETAREHDQKLKVLHRERDERKTERNQAVLNLVRARNDKVVSEARERNAKAEAAAKRAPTRRSKRHDPYGRKAKKEKTEDDLAANKTVWLMMPMSEMQMIVRALDE